MKSKFEENEQVIKKFNKIKNFFIQEKDKISVLNNLLIEKDKKIDLLTKIDNFEKKMDPLKKDQFKKLENSRDDIKKVMDELEENI